MEVVIRGHGRSDFPRKEHDLEKPGSFKRHIKKLENLHKEQTDRALQKDVTFRRDLNISPMEPMVVLMKRAILGIRWQ